MKKQEQIKKITKDLEGIILYDEVLKINYNIDEVDIEETAKNLVANGYINGADFVEWLEKKYGRLFYEVGYAYREQADLNKALQEYLKGE